MGPQPTESWLSKIRRHIDKVLIAVSGVTLLVGGYFTLDYRNYTECQVRLQEASRGTTTVFAESLRVLLAQPPRSVEERRQAFGKLQAALDQQEAIQREVGDCK
jgi:hypothetical protein